MIYYLEFLVWNNLNFFLSVLEGIGIGISNIFRLYFVLEKLKIKIIFGNLF